MLSRFRHVQLCQLCATLWTVAHQAPLSLGFSRLEYCSGLRFPCPRNLADPGIEPVSLTSNLNWQAGSWPLALTGKGVDGFYSKMKKGKIALWFKIQKQLKKILVISFTSQNIYNEKSIDNPPPNQNVGEIYMAIYNRKFFTHKELLKIKKRKTNRKMDKIYEWTVKKII